MGALLFICESGESTMITASKSARLNGISLDALRRFSRAAQRAAKLAGELEVLIAGDAEVRKLNLRFRGKDQATDVLSFPAVSNVVAGNESRAGDIVISAARARAQAREHGHSAADEIKILMLHGILHLAGMDHERDNGAMLLREERLRAKLGLPNGLIARSATPSVAKSARLSARKLK